MKICAVHNAYGKRSGEEVAIDGLCRCLEEHGHSVVPFYRSSAVQGRSLAGKATGFFSGIYSFSARREFARFLDTEKPDLVHINNLFPFISPSILDETRRRGIPVVMTLHNYRLLCPTGLLMSHGEICHRCVDGHEWWCAARNCTGELPKSVGYAARNWIARSREVFSRSVDRFIAPAEFVKRVHCDNGLQADRITTIPYIVNLEFSVDPLANGEYVGYVGRIGPEKGVETIVEVARRLPDIPFRFAGHFLRMPDLPKQAPPNCRFLGEIPREEIAGFIDNARFTVFASKWYETTGLSIAEAMARAKPVVCSRIGCLPELVQEGNTGLLFEPGNAQDLASKIESLWNRPELCQTMGKVARDFVRRKFSTEDNFARLLRVYEAAMAAHASGLARERIASEVEA